MGETVAQKVKSWLENRGRAKVVPGTVVLEKTEPFRAKQDGKAIPLIGLAISEDWPRP
jgi:hypothetical protein